MNKLIDSWCGQYDSECACYPAECNGCKVNHLRELAEKEEKYRWHDLRKNPKDLPKTICEYACDVAVEWENGDITYDIQSDFVVPQDTNCYTVIAWRYVEPFGEEVE